MVEIMSYKQVDHAKLSALISWQAVGILFYVDGNTYRKVEDVDSLLKLIRTCNLYLEDKICKGINDDIGFITSEQQYNA